MFGPPLQISMDSCLLCRHCSLHVAIVDEICLHSLMKRLISYPIYKSTWGTFCLFCRSRWKEMERNHWFFSTEKIEHLGFLFYFGEKGSERTPLSQTAPFFANSDPNMPAVPVPAAQVHDWLLQNIVSSLERITERASAKENGPTSATDQDVPMADVSASSVKSSSSPRCPNFIEGISETSYVRKPNDLKGASVKININ